MKRRTKVFGLVLVAGLTLNGLVAAAAMPASFTAPSYPATVTGEQAGTHVFTFQGQKVECSNAHFEGSLVAASSRIEITPTYSGCTAFGFVESAIDMNSCYFEIEVGQTTSSPTHFWHGSFHIGCAVEGDSITVTAPKGGSLCNIHIPAQTPTTNKVDLENFVDEVQAVATVEGIHASVTKANVFCPLTTAHTDTSGKISGTTYLEAPGGGPLRIGP